jgi:DNA-binding CsgD family transcriptional regulator
VKIDCIRVVEAAYAPAATPEAWLSELLEPYESLALDHGVLAIAFDLQGPQPRLRVLASRGPVPPAVGKAYRKLWDVVERSPAAIGQAMLAPPPSVCWATQRGAGLPESLRAEIRPFFAEAAMWDYLGVVAIEPRRSGICVCVPYAREVSIPPRTNRQLTRLTAHLCSAMRLRSRAGRPEGVEAVLDPSGRVQHASGDARAAPVRASLTAAVRSVERARGRLRRTDPDEALAIWQALFDGRYSIVERSESDGRRFLLARRNEPSVRDPRALGPSERDVLAYAALGHSNKYIGYLLGISPSTVATRLASGLRKMGLGSRREAIELLGAIASGDEGPPPILRA